MFEFASNPANFLLRLTDEGFVTHSDLVFRFEGVRARGRYVVPAGWNLGRRVKARRSRARAVREFARLNKFCRLDVAEAYIAALKKDGAKIYIHDRAGLLILKALS